MSQTLLILGALLLVIGLILRGREKENPKGKRAKGMAILAFVGYLMVLLGTNDLFWALLPQTQGWAWAVQILSLVVTVAAAYWLLVPTWKD